MAQTHSERDCRLLVANVDELLTARERALLDELTATPGRACPRAELAHAVYADEAHFELLVDVLVAALRRKLRRAHPGREWIVPVDGSSYAFVG